jgi:hypothetical protein
VANGWPLAEIEAIEEMVCCLSPMDKGLVMVSSESVIVCVLPHQITILEQEPRYEAGGGGAGTEKSRFFTPEGGD